MLASLSENHLVIILVVVFLLFGGKKMPELAKGLGEAMKELKKASRFDPEKDEKDNKETHL